MEVATVEGWHTLKETWGGCCWLALLRFPYVRLYDYGVSIVRTVAAQMYAKCHHILVNVHVRSTTRKRKASSICSFKV